MTGFSAIPLAEDGAVTVGLLGVQVFWSVEMSYGTPYLLSLGLSKAAVLTAFLASPISGLVIQPLIGVLTNNSKSRFGRRRPYMLFGAPICTCAMLLLGFTRRFASIFLPGPSSAGLQAIDRALIVDTLPPSDQADANAWAAHMLGIGSVAGYFMLLLHFLLCTRKPDGVGRGASKSFLRELREIWDDARTLPPVIQQIVRTSWIGWFPVLFYMTAFTGDLHKRASSLPSDRLVSPRSRRGLERRLLQAHKSAWARIYERLKVSLATLWATCHLLFAICMFATFFYSTVGGATFFTTLTGFAWSITQWAPFSLLAEAIITEDAPGNEDANSIILHDTRTRRLSGDVTFAGDAHERQFLVGDDDEDEDGDREDTRKDRARSLEEDVQSFSSNASMDEDEGEEHPNRPTPRQAARAGIRAGVGEGEGIVLNNFAARTSHLDVHSLVASDDAMLRGDEDGDAAKSRHGLAAKAGIIIGIHNIFIVIPQFTMAGLASLISFLDPVKTAPDAENGSSLASNTTDPAGSGTGARGGPNSYATIYRQVLSQAFLEAHPLTCPVAFVLTLRLTRGLRYH
ncbi:hypothetical protein C8Q79DRAFT_1021988 [Trametes meyenii]|nr:hypothetical protein C8Q79DRAFT_1021988 [Trametes meyenii]